MDFKPLLYFGQVMHHRTRPAVNVFVYPVFFIGIPLTQLATIGRINFSVDRWNLLSFYQRDHGPRDGRPLLPWVREILQDHDLPANGEVVLQTFPRVLGWVFNPVSFWFCHDRDGQLMAVLAEVNNTFGAHHHYLLHKSGEVISGEDVLESMKCFHVSPFNQIEGRYRFRFKYNRRRSASHIDYDDRSGEVLRTSLAGRAREWQARQLFLAFARMPFLTLGVVFRIHWQALKLWFKGVPFFGTRVSSPLTEPHE